MVDANALPLLAAIDTFVKIRNAFLNITVKHIVLVDLGSASLDDLVGNLGQKTLHSFRGIVVLTELPNDSDVVQSFWKNLWNVFWAALLDLSAWF